MDIASQISGCQAVVCVMFILLKLRFLLFTLFQYPVLWRRPGLQ